MLLASTKKSSEEYAKVDGRMNNIIFKHKTLCLKNVENYQSFFETESNLERKILKLLSFFENFPKLNLNLKKETGRWNSLEHFLLKIILIEIGSRSKIRTKTNIGQPQEKKKDRKIKKDRDRHIERRLQKGRKTKANKFNKKDFKK